MADSEKVGRVDMVLNPGDNGGESVVLAVDLYDNGDKAAGLPGGIFTIGTITLNSYGNSASMIIGGGITPETLREFANKLDAEIIRCNE